MFCSVSTGIPIQILLRIVLVSSLIIYGLLIPDVILSYHSSNPHRSAIYYVPQYLSLPLGDEWLPRVSYSFRILASFFPTAVVCVLRGSHVFLFRSMNIDFGKASTFIPCSVSQLYGNTFLSSDSCLPTTIFIYFLLSIVI